MVHTLFLLRVESSMNICDLFSTCFHKLLLLQTYTLLASQTNKYVFMYVNIWAIISISQDFKLYTTIVLISQAFLPTNKYKWGNNRISHQFQQVLINSIQRLVI